MLTSCCMYIPRYFVQELFGVLPFPWAICVSLGFTYYRLAFTGILIREILAPAVPATPDYPPSQMAPEIGTRPDPHFAN